jgi:hypothetical protein
VVVGAFGEGSAATGVNGDQSDNSATFAGAAYVFVRTGTAWSQQAYLKASNTNFGDQFGASVAISGDTIVVGANLEDSAATGVNGNQADNSAGGAGAAYVFVRSGAVWSQQAYLKASNTNGGDLFGSSVDISGDTIVVGATDEDSGATGVNGNQADESATFAGAAYVFVRTGTTWTQQAYLKASNTDASDGFGTSVAISGDTVVVAAPYEDSSATGINGNQTDNSRSSAGATYVFTGLGPRATLTVVKAGSGSGTVASAPGVINCGATCADDFPAGATVTLTGTPAAGSVLRELTGGGCTGAEPCPVSLTASTTVAATFAGDLVNVAVSRGQFTAGTTIHVAVSVNNATGEPPIANFFAGAVLPDHDTIAFITGSGIALGQLSNPTSYRPIAVGVPLTAPLVLTVPDFLVYTWSGSEPHGSYVLFLAALDAVSGDILGLSTAIAVLGP